jgi:hypothetical protein
MAQLSTTSLAADANLRAYWTFNSSSLTSSVNGYILTNINSVTFATGKYLEAASMGASNTNKYLALGNSVSITSKVLSLSCWVKLQTEISTGAYFFVQHVNNTTDTYFALQYEYNGGNRIVNAQMYKVGGGDVSVRASYSISLGTTAWHHLAAVSDGTNFVLYVDGTQRASNTCPANGSFTIDNRVNIGAYVIPSLSATPSQYASALIDDVAIFNRALTAGEVSQLASDGGNSGFFAVFD